MRKKTNSYFFLFFFFVSKRDARAVVNLVFICIAGTAVAATFNLDREYLYTPHGHTGDITRMIVVLLSLSFHVGGGLSPVPIRITILLLLLIHYIFI
jgi:hypothetical protein